MRWFLRLLFTWVLLACIGIGTPNWQTTYTLSSNQLQISSTNNFFYACVFTTNNNVTCYNRNASLTGYINNGFSSLFYTFAAGNDTNTRLQNAGGLSIVGIGFLAFGVIAALIMAFAAVSAVLNLIPTVLLFLACLFMLAGLAEGSRALIYNDYAANLYQTAHLLTMLSFGLSALVAGRAQNDAT
jgi:hypothetical protein